MVFSLFIGFPPLLGQWGVVLASPVRLHEHGVDLLQIDGFGLVAHGLDEGGDAEIAGGAQDAFGRLDDEV